MTKNVERKVMEEEETEGEEEEDIDGVVEIENHLNGEEEMKRILHEVNSKEEDHRFHFGRSTCH